MLQIRFVNHLAEVVEPVAQWLNVRRSGSGLFAPDHLVVPTNGAKAWLLPELARRVGSREGRDDGVIANVQVGYVGSLNKFVSPTRYVGVDPWSIEAMTGVILDLIVDDERYLPLIAQRGGALQAARRLADRFDRYHVRRPTMIRAWERGLPVLAPSTSDQTVNGELLTADLGDQRWQFELWTQLRARIGVESWPMQVESTVERMRSGENPVGLPSRLMVAGLQSLSPAAIELLEAFGSVSDVEVLLVHPSPSLAAIWDVEGAALPRTRGVFPLRSSDDQVPEGIHPLLHSWLRGSREMQQMLATQGLPVQRHGKEVQPDSTSLLQRLQTAVATSSPSSKQPFEPADRSVQIHRCYSLARQVDALHDAIIQAFVDIPDLAPHDVVILSPRIQDAAPLLEAAFDRDVKVQTAKGTSTIRVPLAVADRGLRQISPGAELLANLLELMTSRFDIDSFMAVAASPIVLAHLGIDDDDVEVWKRQIDRTRVRWGLSKEHRTSLGLAPEAESAHTWQLAVERSLLGAALPDAAPQPELGGIVPLDDVGIDELDAMSGLAQIFNIIVRLEEQMRGGTSRTIADWRHALETTLSSLCGDDDQVSDAFDALAALGAVGVIDGGGGVTHTVDAQIPFVDLAGYLLETLSGSPGFMPLRTGAITATSFIPLRGIPYRVVCLLGIDDGVSSSREPESDDLIGTQLFIGDDDHRLELRRQILDSMMSAGHRLIVTCDGRSILNNAPVPLTTPLAEFADFCRTNGVGEDKNGNLEIEYFHPRHNTSTANFLRDGVMPGAVWSHSVTRNETAKKVGVELERKILDIKVKEVVPTIVDIEELERFIKSPLNSFVRNVLRINRWREDQSAEEAIIPLSMERRMRQRYVEGCIHGLAEEIPGWTLESHHQTARLNGDLPVGGFGESALAEMDALAQGFKEKCSDFKVSLSEPEEVPLMTDLGDGVVLRGALKGLEPVKRKLTVVQVSDKYKKDVAVLGLRLLVARAAGLDVRYAIPIHQHYDDNTKAIARLVYLADTIDADSARHRLLELVYLYGESCRRPFPSFGDTVDRIFKTPKEPNLELGRTNFEKFVKKSDNGRGENYSDSDERLIYGDSPDFDAIFVDGGLVLDYWSRFHGVFHLENKQYKDDAATLPYWKSHWKVT